jgi:hypothetical protein
MICSCECQVLFPHLSVSSLSCSPSSMQVQDLAGHKGCEECEGSLDIECVVGRVGVVQTSEEDSNSGRGQASSSS